ncbi:MAG: signal recognition particle-docking protein FtsY [Anaerolineae bacterium]|nr:signal recognition particle-docking protein FtsY [Anaerolineae bacterium]MDW8103127.1 signal recognition particle-docking protein FtsY [Anaerolineae bacterium]
MNLWRIGLEKTRKGFLERLRELFGGSRITPDMWEELEALLIQADLGVKVTAEILKKLRSEVQHPEELRPALRRELLAILGEKPSFNLDQGRPLNVFLIVGVNGSGKTTSIAKLAHYCRQKGHKVILAAADTFRAAAIDQLKIWGERVGADVIAHQPGADPGAVVYDAIQASLARGATVLIVDTAGRLHTKYNLMQELKKIRNVASKLVPGSPHETLLVLDATFGQNALSQALHFKEAVEITGIILAKLDGTAKGGAIFPIVKELGIPVKFVGTGEKLGDWAEFDPQAFVDALLE